MGPAEAQQQFKWKLQSANPAGTPHMEIFEQIRRHVDAISGGRLKIEVLPSGAIVNPFEILDAVNKGVIDSGQWWTHYATGKHPAGGLFSAPLGGAGSGLDMFNNLPGTCGAKDEASTWNITRRYSRRTSWPS